MTTTAEHTCEVKVGEFSLSKGIEPYKIWIELPGGEGGDFSEADLAELIRRFYRERF